MNRRVLFTGFADTKPRPKASLGPEHYTNAVLRTHENKEVRFYDDCIKGKIVAINFFYVQCTGACPRTTANLMKAYEQLKDRIGRDIFIYSITLKPQEDDPEMLKHYVDMHKIKMPGWTFLTGDPYDIDTIRFRLFRWEHPALDLDIDQHTGMVRVINDNNNVWSMCPTFATPRQIVDVIHWVEPTKPLAVRIRENMARQAQIDKETKHWSKSPKR